MVPKLHSFLLYSKDPKAVAEFYKELGFENVKEDENQTRVISEGLILSYMDQNKVEFTLDPKIPRGEGIYIYFEVENVDQFYQTLKDKGLQTSSEPKDWPWGKREFVIRDPDRYKLVFYQKL